MVTAGGKCDMKKKSKDSEPVSLRDDWERDFYSDPQQQINIYTQRPTGKVLES